MNTIELSNTSLRFIESRFTVIEASRFIIEHGIEGAQVIDNSGQIIGFLTRADLLKAISEGHPPETNVVEIMLDASAVDKGNIKVFDQAIQRVLGISLQETYGPNIDAVFDNPQMAYTKENAQIEATPKIEAVGQTFLSDLSPIYADGETTGAGSVLQDTSELEEALQELVNTKKLNQQMDAIIESSFDGLYITDGKGITLRLNQGFERIMGVTAAECIGRSMQDLVNDGVFSRSGTLVALERGGSATITLQAKTGKHALVTSTPIYDDDGIPILVVTNVRDISELNELERKLEHVEGLRRKELDAIFESSYDGLYITDGEANTLMLNHGFERIMGVTAADCIGRNMRDLVNEGVYSRSGTLIALERGGSATISVRAKTGKHALVTSTPIYDDGIPILVVTNVRDITELNELQGKLEQLEGLSRLYQEELQALKLLHSKKCVVHSQEMQELMKMVIHIASVDSTVLIQGESGVGKEIIANILHSNSNRKDGPFIKINCGAIPYNLIESELFGYEPGAFTGAGKKGKAGMFELANGGIIFLDEIGELPLDLQVKLLRVIQEMEITRIGAIEPTKIDVRVVTATNRNLYEMMEKHQFRADLYYRLNVVPIFIPPLRERRDEIPVLSKYFLEYFNQKYNMKKELSSYVQQRFMSYDWPGNVRELENLIERLVVTTRHDTISLYDLFSGTHVFKTTADMESEIIPLQSALENTERKLLQNAFSIYNSTYAVARALGVSQPTVVRKVAKYGIMRN